MPEEHEMKVIARIHNDFPTKFGIPHQSNRLEALKATIVFEPEYRIREAFRGLEEYSYIWLIWQFSEAVREDWSPTVRPPRLVIIPGLFEPPVRTLRATIPENESHIFR